MSLQNYKLSEEEKAKFLSKECVILNDAQKLNEYQNFVSTQKDGFIRLMNYINTLVMQYKRHGDLSSFVEFRARIKSPESAIANDSSKTLDDVFGMELICATQTEIDFLIKELSTFMHTQHINVHDKPNGYKAKHYYSYLDPSKYNLLYPTNSDTQIEPNIIKEQDRMPLVEFQLKTIEVSIKTATGSAGHYNYKKIDKNQIQQAFDNNNLKVGYNLPFMWVSSNDVNNPEMKLLSADETAKKLYPFIDTTRRDKDFNRNS